VGDVREVRVSSWAELQDAVYADSWQAHLGRFRSPFVFRGMSDVRHTLVTSLMRLGGSTREVERHLLRNFRKYAHRNMLERGSYWYWLAVGQHHGLPTRLLDWSYSPLVALHFATADPAKYDRDGVVWMVNYDRTNERLPDVLREALTQEGSVTFTVEMLDAVTSARATRRDTSAMFETDVLGELERCADAPFLLFFEPPSIDDRIMQQWALFSFLSDPTRPLDAWLEDVPDAAQRIIIPAGLKWEVRDKLDQANITERTLFPGLGGLSTWLTRYYSPREARGPE